MAKNRFFNILITIALVIVVALTVREAAATAGVIADTGTTKGAGIVKCLSLPSPYSIRTEYVKEANMWIIRTEDGPAGVDGGFMDLLSDYRTCTK